VLSLIVRSGKSALASNEMYALEQSSCFYGPVEVLFNSDRIEAKLVRQGLEVQSRAPFKEILVASPSRHLVAKETFDLWIALGASPMFYLPQANDLPKDGPRNNVKSHDLQCFSVTWAPRHEDGVLAITGGQSGNRPAMKMVQFQAEFLDSLTLPGGLHDFFLGLYRIGTVDNKLPIRFNIKYRQSEQLPLNTLSLRILKSPAAKFDDYRGYRIARLPDVVSSNGEQKMMEQILTEMVIRPQNAATKH